ncbi:alpha/beta fold hydrolase [Deinococcus aerophilus]|uniref:Hydrolase n=1 Tax=Deinococcus aerophilus TaxID=522488 RepID=A0ABQ2GZE3_9DEIO|nr:alpha/beta hydrolase [Deinococcus aerophilus]GGM19851.1 hydrolase [Deinococcus aerophilus]
MNDPKGSTFARQSNVKVAGTGERTILCAHGFCSNQGVFRHQIRAFGPTHRVVSYDLAGFGQSAPALWDARRYASLQGYAEDMVQLIDELELSHITLMAASMSAMVGLLASLARPERFEALILISASPRYLNDDPYYGGFQQPDVDSFYQLVDSQQAWADALVGMMLNRPVSLPLQEIAESVQGVTPQVAGVVARAIFQSDFRALLPQVTHPVLVTQTRADSVVPESVGHHLHRHLPQATLEFLPGVGHMPNFTEPEHFNRVAGGFLRGIQAAS